MRQGKGTWKFLFLVLFRGKEKEMKKNNNEEKYEAG